MTPSSLRSPGGGKRRPRTGEADVIIIIDRPDRPSSIAAPNR